MRNEDYFNHKELLNTYGFKEHQEVVRKVSRKDRYEVLKRQSWNCNICGVKLKYSKTNDWEGEVAHIDHIHPFSQRFTYPRGAESINESENLQALCPNCNLKKTNKEIC